MDLIKQIQKLKNIQADPEYIRLSRRSILGGGFEAVETRSSPWKIFIRTLELAPTIALAALLVLLTVGGLSSWKFLAPFAGLDPGGLRAEAEAIDLQIQLTNIAYEELPRNEETTPSTAGAVSETPDFPEGDGVAEPSATEPDSISIDQALQELAD